MTGGGGRLITLEGVDGSGKTTQLSLLRDALLGSGREVVCLREPGGTAISEKIRALLLDPLNDAMCDECELLLYEASRAQLVCQTIRPALAAGSVVLCDRFYDSTFAYQAGGRGMGEGLVLRANAIGACGVVPDRTLVLDIDPELAYERATRGGADRMETAGLDLQRRVRDGYLRLAELEPERVRLVDAVGPAEEVNARIVAELLDLCPELGATDGR